MWAGSHHIRRTRERLSFVAPKLIRSGPVEPDILARVIKGLDLAPDAIMASKLGGQRLEVAGNHAASPGASSGAPSELRDLGRAEGRSLCSIQSPERRRFR